MSQLSVSLASTLEMYTQFYLVHYISMYNTLSIKTMDSVKRNGTHYSILANF